MKQINLDPKKLLGFKIIAEGSAAELSSPKIGDKSCTVYADAASLAGETSGSVLAGIGTEVD